jgi:ABC-2 type transport system permease protein
VNTLTGTAALAKMAARRDRTMLAIWLYALAALVAASAYGFKKLYPTAVSRDQFIAGANHNPALLSIYGPFYGTSLASFTAWRDSTLAALLIGLMSIFIVVRHTRADEEAGRLELVGSAVVGRHAPLVAAMLVSVGANITIGVVMAVVAIVLGLPASGSIVLAAGIAGCGLAFTAVAAVTAQVASTARSARGIAIGVLGAVFLLRAIGDSVSATGPRWLTWLSPIGWAGLDRAYGESRMPTGVGCGASKAALCYADQSARWWVPLLAVATAVVVATAAAVLAVRRDYDAGVLAQRPGAPQGAGWLRTPVALAWRLQRASFFGWVGGALVYGVGVGSASKGIGALLGSGQVRRVVERMGGHWSLTSSQHVREAQLTNSYLTAILTMSGLAVAGFAISAVLRLRSEETEERADPVLATRAGRMSWGLSHVVIAAVGSVAILAVVGLGLGRGYGARSGLLGHEIASLLGASLAQAPAVLVLAGIAVALFGLAPGSSVTGSWSVLGVVVALLFVGAALQLSHWVLDVSPFTHLPKLPGGTVSVAPLVWLCVIAVALACAGLVGLRRRDIANAG